MRQLEPVDGAGHRADNLPRRDVVMIDALVDVRNVAGRVVLPHFHATGVHQFGGIALGRPQQPGDEGGEPLGLILVNGFHDVMVVAHQHIKALVDAGRVFQFLVRMPGREGRNRRVERGGVTQADVLVAGGERAGHAPHAATVRQSRAAHRRGHALFLGPHLASGVDLGPGDVAVHVDAAGHDDQTGRIESAVGGVARIGRRGDDLAPLEPHVGDLTVDAIGRVVDVAARDFPQIATHEPEVSLSLRAVRWDAANARIAYHGASLRPRQGWSGAAVLLAPSATRQS